MNPFNNDLNNKWTELYFWIMVFRLFHVCFFGAERRRVELRTFWPVGVFFFKANGSLLKTPKGR